MNITQIEARLGQRPNPNVRPSFEGKRESTHTVAREAIREREILRVAGSLKGDDQELVLRTAAVEVLRWAQNKAIRKFPSEAWRLSSFEQIASGRSRVAVHIEDEEREIWSIRVEDPDREMPGRIWANEISLIRSGQSTRFTVRQLVGSPEASLDVEPHVPGFVRQVISTVGLYSGLNKLTDKALLANSEQRADLLIQSLLDANRTLPIIVLTVPSDSEDENKPLIEGKTLAQACAGLAIVVVLPARFTWKLTERFGKQLSVYEGAIRIYQRGFTEDANPFGGHDLILPDRFSSHEGVIKTLKRLRWGVAIGSVTRLSLGTDVPTFASLRLESLNKRQMELQKSGATDAEQLQTAQKQIENLETKVRETEDYLTHFSDLHTQAEERAITAESQLRAAGFRIRQLTEQVRARGEAPDENITPPDNWGIFADWCDTNLAGRLTLSPQARRTLRDANFADVPLAARCLLWLANDYHSARVEESDGSLRDKTLEPGIINAHCGSDTFSIEWQGRKYDVAWHIKNGGNTRDPSRCLRIYYFWDDSTQQVVIASMPAHRRTDAS